MISKLKTKKFRQAFVAANVRRGIAYQLRAMRGPKTQGQIGEMVGKPQNVISRLEDPRYGKVTVQTLLDVAAAYDVALLVKFVSYGRLMAETENLSQDALVPLSYEAETKLKENPARPGIIYSTGVTTTASIAVSSPQFAGKQQGTGQFKPKSYANTQLVQDEPRATDGLVH